MDFFNHRDTEEHKVDFFSTKGKEDTKFYLKKFIRPDKKIHIKKAKTAPGLKSSGNRSAFSVIKNH